MGPFDKLKRGLAKTKQVLQTDVRDLFKAGDILDEPKLLQFESRLLKTDMGVEAAGAIVADLREHHGGRTVVLNEIWDTVKRQLLAQLSWDAETGWFHDLSLETGRWLEGTPKSLASFVPMWAGLASDAQAAQMIEHLAIFGSL